MKAKNPAALKSPRSSCIFTFSERITSRRVTSNTTASKSTLPKLRKSASCIVRASLCGG
jgi:hypothetical protein